MPACCLAVLLAACSGTGGFTPSTATNASSHSRNARSIGDQYPGAYSQTYDRESDAGDTDINSSNYTGTGGTGGRVVMSGTRKARTILINIRQTCYFEENTPGIQDPANDKPLGCDPPDVTGYYIPDTGGPEMIGAHVGKPGAVPCDNQSRSIGESFVFQGKEITITDVNQVWAPAGTSGGSMLVGWIYQGSDGQAYGQINMNAAANASNRLGTNGVANNWMGIYFNGAPDPFTNAASFGAIFPVSASQGHRTNGGARALKCYTRGNAIG